MLEGVGYYTMHTNWKPKGRLSEEFLVRKINIFLCFGPQHGRIHQPCAELNLPHLILAPNRSVAPNKKKR